MDFYTKAKETLERLRCVDGVIFTQQNILEEVIREVYDSAQKELVQKSEEFFDGQLPLPITPDESPY